MDDDGSEVRAATTGLGGGGTTTTPDPEGPVTAKATTNLDAATNGLGGGPTPDPEGATTNGVGDRETAEATDTEAASSASTDPENGVDATGPEATNGGEAAEAEEQLELLRAYAARYSGRTVVARLIFIARRCGLESTEIESLRMAFEEARKGKDTIIYDEIWNLINWRIPTAVYDYDWVESVSLTFSTHLQLLQNMMDATQEGRMKKYTDLGNWYYSHGYLAESFKSYMKTEEYSTSPEQLVQICSKSILVNIELEKYDRVLEYVGMTEGSQAPLDAVTAAKLHAAAGLAHLGKMEYRLAALRFLETGPELENNYTEVIHPVDVAIYGALCALASFDSAEIKVRVMENVNFQYFLQYLPQAQHLVYNFYHGRHEACLQNFEALRPYLLLDMYLADHVATLYLVISQKSGYVVVPEDSELEDFLRTSSPIANEGEEEPTAGETEPQNAIISSLVLPSNFDDKTLLSVSAHYRFLNAKDLLLSIGKRSSDWVSRLNAHALLVNASLFVCDSVDDEEDRFDGRISVVSSVSEVNYSSYTSTHRALKETKLKDKEESAIDRFQIKGNIWTRRRICLKSDHTFHVLQWRKTAGLKRAQVQAAEAAAQIKSNTQLDETMKSLIEQLKDHTQAMAQSTKAFTLATQSIVDLNSSLAEARKSAATAAAGGVAT